MEKIKFWSVIPGVEEITPILPARDFIPDWWKKAPAHAGSIESHESGRPATKLSGEFLSSLKNSRFSIPVRSMADTEYAENEGEKDRSTGTIKLCPAIHDWFDCGYVLPMWCDLNIELFEDGQLGETDGKPYNFNTPHPTFQGGLMDNITYIHWLPKEQQKRGAVGFINLECPWRMMTPPGISCFQFPMWWHFNPDFEVPPGPIWTDEYAQVNPQIIIKHYGKITIKRGTPLCVFVPYERSSSDELELEIMSTDKNGNVQDEECKKHETKTDIMVQTVFKGGYRKMQKSKEAKCPFPHDNKSNG